MTGKRSLHLTKFFLTMIYWFIVVPVGVVRRVLGIGKYQPSLDASGGSYWRSRPLAEAPSVRYRKPY